MRDHDLDRIENGLSAAERRGFDLACDTLAQWGRRIAHEGRSLPPVPMPKIPDNKVMQHAGHMIAGCADMLRHCSRPSEEFPGEPAATVRAAPAITHCPACGFQAGSRTKRG